MARPTNENPEQATIRGFVVRPKQGLYLALLSNRDARPRLTKMLLSGRDIDPRSIAQIPDDEQKPAQIAERLRKLGAPDDCHLIAEDGAIDGRDLALDDALKKVVGGGKGALICCVAGRLGYFEGSNGERFVVRTGGRASGTKAKRK